MRKKILSLLLALAVFATFGPLEIFAESESPISNLKVTASNFNNGKCDITATWEGTATSYEVKLGENDPQEATTNSYTFTNVTADEVYDVKVDESTAKVFANEVTAEVTDDDVVIKWHGNKTKNLSVKDKNLDSSVFNGNVVYTTSETLENLEIGQYDVVLSYSGESVETTFEIGYNAAVTGLQTLSGSSAVTLKWDRVEDADSYLVERSNGAAVAVPQTEDTTVVKSIGVATDSSATFKVYAVKNGVKSSEFAQASDSPVRTMYYSFKFKKKKKLTSHGGTYRKVTFPKNFYATAVGFQKGKYQFWYNGSLFYVQRISTKSQGVATYNGNKYSEAEAENFINATWIGSSTNYLVWVNSYTQREYIFKGYAGHWDCINGSGWDISTGAPKTPTATGVTKIKKKIKKRHGIKYWNMCSVYSLHSKKSKWQLGWPRSGGCVRNYDSNAQWIYNNVPKKSAVYLY